MINPFDGISPHNQKKLLNLLHHHVYTYHDDQDIMETYKSDDVIGIITKGEAKIIHTDYYGNQIVIDELKIGNVFGTKISAITNNEFEIKSIGETEVIVIDYNLLISIDNTEKKYYNDFIRNLLIIVTEKLMEKNRRIRVLTKKTIRYKLLEYFRMQREYTKSHIIYLPFNYSDLANYLGIDRSAMTRELGYMKEEGFIETKGKRITINFS